MKKGLGGILCQDGIRKGLRPPQNFVFYPSWLRGQLANLGSSENWPITAVCVCFHWQVMCGYIVPTANSRLIPTVLNSVTRCCTRTHSGSRRRRTSCWLWAAALSASLEASVAGRPTAAAKLLSLQSFRDILQSASGWKRIRSNIYYHALVSGRTSGHPEILCFYPLRSGRQLANLGSPENWPSHGYFCLFVFSLTGNVWIYGSYNRFSADSNSPEFCHPVLYTYAFWLTSSTYILLAVSTCFVCITGVLCGCR